MKTRILVRKQYNECPYEPFTGEIEIVTECKNLEELANKYRKLEDTLNDLICERIRGLQELNELQK